jgi:hypothetical protein
MNIHWKILILIGVFIAAVFLTNPAMARRADTSLIAYDRWIAEDYRYQSWNTPANTVVTDPEYIADAEKFERNHEFGDGNAISAIFGVFDWIGKSVGSLVGLNAPDPYEDNSPVR